MRSDGERHPGDEEIQDALDRRLPADLLAVFDDHLRACRDCRWTWEAFAWAKQQASRTPLSSPPASLAERIARTLDEEDRRMGRRPLSPGRKRLRVGVAAAGTIAAVLVFALLVARRSDPTLVVARDHAAFLSGHIRLTLETGDVRRMEAHFERAGLGFPARVFDLGMMKYELVGGRVHAVGRHPSAFFVYRGLDGGILLCQMYRGSLRELPPGERHVQDGIPFLVYRRDGLTLVFWPEGDILCVLAGEGGPEVVLPLAIAKAARVPRAPSPPL